MSGSAPLHDLLTGMVQAYSQKNQPPRIPIPAEISTYLHSLLDRMCAEAEGRNASDIFVSADFPPAVKISGVLSPIPHKALAGEETAAIVESTMNLEQLETFNQNWEISYSMQSRNNTHYRVNAYHEQGRVDMVLHRTNQKIPEIGELGLPPKLKDLALTPHGMLILTGPTGTDKSTIMALALDYRNNKIPGHIVTIEDPIEYIYKPRRCVFTQREVGIDTPDWKIAVQNAMHQAPDVVCTGEVRSESSMECAMQLAQTGHLYVFTIHADSTVQATKRITNFYSGGHRPQVLMDLALSLIGIIGQRLVIHKNRTLRTAVIDLLLNTPAMQDLTSEGDLMNVHGSMQRSSTEGMRAFGQHLFSLYTKDQVEYDETLRQADSINDSRLHIQMYEEGNDPARLYDRISDLNLMQYFQTVSNLQKTA